MSDLFQSIRIVTAQGEAITYHRQENGYWTATQEGMPDEWHLSRVASRAVDELVNMVKCQSLSGDAESARSKAEAAWFKRQGY